MESIRELLDKGHIAAIHARVLREKAEKLRNGQSLNVYFFVCQKQFWSLQSVYDALAAHPCFRLHIVPFPTAFHTPGEAQKHYYELCEFHEKKGASVIHVYDPKSSLLLPPSGLSPDVIFYEQHWMNSYYTYTICNMVDEALCICIPYGVMIANIPEDQFNGVAHNLAWRNFAETPMHFGLSRKYADNKGINTVVSGYPKFDAYQRPVTKNYWKTESPHVKRLIWAPHYSINTKKDVDCATFHLYWRKFLDLVKNNGDRLEMVLKPHPALKSQWVRTGFSGKVLDRYMDEWNSLPNASVVTDGDYIDLFATSDALILDSLSFISEYMITGKPLCFLSKFPDFEQLATIFNDYGKTAISLVDRAYSFDDVVGFIDGVCDGTARVSEDRAYFTETMLKVNFGRVGEFIANYLLEQLRAA